jgi:hypothetical protein
MPAWIFSGDGEKFNDLIGFNHRGFEERFLMVPRSSSFFVAAFFRGNASPSTTKDTKEHKGIRRLGDPVRGLFMDSPLQRFGSIGLPHFVRDEEKRPR